MGNFNEKIGKERIFKPTIGQESLHQVSLIYIYENGIRLITLAMSRNMLISSTFFPQKSIYKKTWMSPNGTTKNQIDLVVTDYIIIH